MFGPLALGFGYPRDILTSRLRPMARIAKHAAVGENGFAAKPIGEIVVVCEFPWHKACCAVLAMTVRALECGDANLGGELAPHDVSLISAR